ncbi:hypothetical protein ACFQZE_06350 [Paenibacillus sp. GCM10027627]
MTDAINRKHIEKFRDMAEETVPILEELLLQCWSTEIKYFMGYLGCRR